MLSQEKGLVTWLGTHVFLCSVWVKHSTKDIGFVDVAVGL